MKKLIFIALAILLSGCFSAFDQTIEYRVDPRVVQFVDRFYTEAEARGVVIERYNLIVIVQPHNTGRFVDQNDPTAEIVGLSIRQGEQRIVFIDERYVEFKDRVDLNLEQLVFHELGHALLGKHHDENSFSVMNTDFNIEFYYKENIRKEVLDNLFY